MKMGNEKMKISLENITQTMEDQDVEFVRFEFGDLYGISRSKIVPVRHFKDKASNGIGIPLCHLCCSIDGCMLHETPYGDGVIGTGDAIWFPDTNTFRLVPWCPKTASILLEPIYKGKRVTCFPRYIARKQLERLEQLGISLFAAHEHEFYVVNRETGKPLTQDSCLRSTIRNYSDPDLLNQLMTDLYKVGIDVEMGETEHGHGQMEITYKPTFGIQVADNAHVFKTAVKEIAQRRGYIASFMSKPFCDQIGSSAHFCHSLWDKSSKQSLLYDATNSTGLSKLGQYWMAGILNHARAITMLMAPTANCYKRHGELSYVSTGPNWGIDNRSCMLRVKINGSKGTYIEYRSSGSGSNPYLTLAAVVAAGIDGIEQKLPLPPETSGNAFKLKNGISKNESIPSNLQDAMDAFKEDDVIMKAFGDDFYNVFLGLKSYEINAKKSVVDTSEEESYKWDRKLFFNYL